ncbi:MAG TPA: dTDP-4-amino-4,6-dideoxygalactose transaminase, partial [bacterium]|nr:dTDP-4-amino-4,6-dideoxygalactose transaminase [bacterium]
GKYIMGPEVAELEAQLSRFVGVAHCISCASGTDALVMALMAKSIGPGDAVFTTPFTFVASAEAIATVGATPVFVDIRPDTLNLDETKVEEAITSKTKAIVAVHYAGVGCEMDALGDIARRHRLWLVEDAAQGIGAQYKGKPLGSLGHLGALSFHETKNVISGEGGALLVNEESFSERAEIIREKGTNRISFQKGMADKYTWVDIGSSYLPSELIAAFLWAQFENFEPIMKKRMDLWLAYHRALEGAEKKGLLRRPVIPAHCRHNAHMYYILLPTPQKRKAFLAALNQNDIWAVFHYVPLHNSPAGQKYGRAHGSLQVTVEMSERIARLPLWVGMEEHQERVIGKVLAELEMG